MAAEPLGILSVFQAGRKGKTQGENHFFFFPGKPFFILRDAVSSLGLLSTFHWPEMSRVTNLATVETGTNGWLSSLYKKKVIGKGLRASSHVCHTPLRN